MRRIVLNPEMMQVAGDLVTGVLLSQINWWYRVPGKNGKSKCRIERDGSLWIAKTREEWMAETGLTLKQYKRALGVLKRKGLVEVKLFQFHGSTMSHIRMVLTDGPFGPTAMVPFGPTQWSLSAQPPISISFGFNDLQTSYIEDSIDDSHIFSEAKTASHPEENEKKIQPGIEVEKMNLKESLEKVQQKKIERMAGQGGSMTMFWQARISTLYGGEFLKPLTVKEASQLKQLQKYLLDDTKKVVDWCLNNWWKFSMEAKAAAGLDNVPSDPRQGGIGFILKHCTIGMNLYLQSIAKVTQVQLIPPPQPIYAPALKQEEKPATKEEIEKLMAGEYDDELGV